MTPDTSAGTDVAAVKQRLRKMNSKASQLKLDLHDLSEELPLGWETILDVARRTYDAYAEIALLENELRASTADGAAKGAEK
ncbi:putative conserved small protein containing a coiled-coil domain [Frankia sp. EI5c]|uniref:CCE_0567 family metalloprotein n=1 Tax=Frankia sp. EI5c TaxID=683316 RepID=UPI0007C3DBFB|nr:CCE_0567 family metalloprotein [Frankia sp. EI5c]OAA26886.1 putative conserved small protein containing a coiled-coil domain [Frankia sp. EI5c]